MYGFWENNSEPQMTSAVRGYSGSANVLDSSYTDNRVLKWMDYVNTYKTSTNWNMQAVAYLLDTSKWNGFYRNSEFADYAIGGPTLEMFIASYNNKHKEVELGYSFDQTGYYIGTGGNNTLVQIPENTLDLDDDLYFPDGNWWISSPSARASQYVHYAIGYTGKIGPSPAGFYASFRPVICLKSGVTLEDNRRWAI